MEKKFDKKAIKQIEKIYSEWGKKLKLSGKNHNEYLLILIRASGIYLRIYEQWKDIPEYEGIYQVSNFGRIKSLKNSFTRKEKILKQNDSRGYLKVFLWKNGNSKTRAVHQLVAESFLNHIRCGFKLVINHKDFNKANNNLDNLEITTHRENTNRKHIKSTSQYTGVCWDKKYKIWRSQIQLNGTTKHLGGFINEIDASYAYQEALKSILKTTI